MQACAVGPIHGGLVAHPTWPGWELELLLGRVQTGSHLSWCSPPSGSLLGLFLSKTCSLGLWVDLQPSPQAPLRQLTHGLSQEEG